jgi:hypothetical protein
VSSVRLANTADARRSSVRWEVSEVGVGGQEGLAGSEANAL